VADQKKWFKVWTSILDDPHFQELSLEDIGAWVLLGAMTAKVGNRGVLAVPGAGRRLREVVRQDDIEHVKTLVSRLPSVQFGGVEHANGEPAVTWKNWRKYQEDTSIAVRVSRLRSKRRGEERRREEKRREEPPSPPVLHSGAPTRPADPGTDPLFAAWWSEYPRKIGQPRALKAWRSLHLNGQTDAVMGGLTRWRAYWTRQQTPTDRIPYPASWLNDRRWEDDVDHAPPDPYAQFPRD